MSFEQLLIVFMTAIIILVIIGIGNFVLKIWDKRDPFASRIERLIKKYKNK